LSCWNIIVCICADRMLSRQARSSISWAILYQGLIFQSFCTACQHVFMNILLVHTIMWIILDMSPQVLMCVPVQ
jgi:hypothetical protein